MGPTPGPTPVAANAAMPSTALVLGGSSDIATAILSRLASDGLQRVVLALRDVDRAPELPAGVESSVVAWDVLDTEGHAGLVRHAADLLGRIDLVICAVGMLGHHAGVSMGPEQVDEMLRTNTVGPAAALAAVGAQLVRQRHGTVVVLSSVAGVRPRRSNYVYGSSKSGLDAFARGLADAVAADGVDVVVVRPGFVRSSMTKGLDPAPFATDPDVVAAAVQQRLRRGGRGVVWVPSRLGWLFAVLGALPRSMWRRVAADR